jgi:O-antigen/teichoic acid export membrane protein
VFGGGVIVIVGKALILRWMGSSYVDAYPVLVILTIAIMAELIQKPSNNVLFAIAKHRFYGITNIVEGILNLALSVLLIREFGIIGVAFGTMIPLLIFKLIVLPVYTCRCIALSPKDYYRNVLPAVICTAGYLGMYYLLVSRYLLTPDYFRIMLAVIIPVPIYVVFSFFILFNNPERILFRKVVLKWL